MLLLISPAKTLDFDSKAQTSKFTQCAFLDESQRLIDELSKLDDREVSALMKISEQLGKLNSERYKLWQTPFTLDNAKQALLAFKGDVYTGLAAQEFSSKDLQFAQQHLRILSGLYGLLRPLDLIQAYRLEMGTKFANPKGKNLYNFWGDQLTDAINQQLSKHSDKLVINLASNEYFKAVKTKNLQGRVITPIFKDLKNGQYKIISFYAKKARGMMAAYIIKNQLLDAQPVQGFDSGGYQFQASLSTGTDWVFTRDTPE